MCRDPMYSDAWNMHANIDFERSIAWSMHGSCMGKKLGNSENLGNQLVLVQQYWYNKNSV